MQQFKCFKTIFKKKQNQISHDRRFEKNSIRTPREFVKEKKKNSENNFSYKNEY